MTGQGILLVGMMTEGIVTPFLSDRDLALENVRYVLGAAGGLAEDFRPAPDGFVATRARQVLSEAVELLGTIADDGLLPAIASGTFGITKRPADGGKGLDGVVPHADGAGAGREDGHGPGDGRARQGDGTGVHVLRRVRPDQPPRRPVRGRGDRAEYPLLAAKEVNLAIRETLRRKLVVLGACIGTDAHTVGIDAILNVKGFAGEKGLEYYREIEVVNLGAQVLVPELVARAKAEKADAILVSQVVTQKDAHLRNTRELAEAVRAASWSTPGRPLVVIGGPRFDVTATESLGVDRIFGKGTTPGEVASYLAHKLRTGWDR
jgi:methylmalonyl-CoA mutase cobalamin-binding subunit